MQSNGQLQYIQNIKRNKMVLLFLQILLTSTLIITWEILSQKGIINSFIYSSPSKIINEIRILITNKMLLPHILETLKEIIIAFSLGMSLSFIIAIIFYEIPFLAKLFDPFLIVFNSMPKVALGPIIIIIFGANTNSIIFMALCINIIVSIITIYNGFISVNKNNLIMFNTFKASKKDTLLYLIIPSSYKNIIASLKLNISLTLIGVITGEFLVSKKGIGYLIIYGTQVFNLNLVFAGIIILLFISYVLYKFVVFIENKRITIK